MRGTKNRFFSISWIVLLLLGALLLPLVPACKSGPAAAVPDSAPVVSSAVAPAVSAPANTTEAAAPQLPLQPPPPAPVVPSLGGAIVTVDKYGNVHTNIDAAAIEAAGFEPGDMLHLKAGTFDGDLPLVNDYADVQRGDPLVRVSNGSAELSISYGNFSEKNAVSQGTPVSITLVSKGTYKAEMELRKLTKSDKRNDYSSDAVFANFREVKMGGVPEKILYRSCHPALGDARAPYAARLAELAKISTVINLADTPDELAQHAASVPWYQVFITRGNLIALGMGVDYTSHDFSAKLKTGLQFMLSHNAPFLIHCDEGKDRAGVVAALLEALMGASPDEIVDDYMLSYVNYYGFVKGEERYSAVSGIILDILKDFNGGIAPKAGETTGAAEKYLRGTIGLSDDEIGALKLKLAGK